MLREIGYWRVCTCRRGRRVLRTALPYLPRHAYVRMQQGPSFDFSNIIIAFQYVLVHRVLVRRLLDCFNVSYVRKLHDENIKVVIGRMIQMKQ